jgi:hypothetical protein
MRKSQIIACNAKYTDLVSSILKFKRAKIVACKPKPNYRVWIPFDDGLEGEIDLIEFADQDIFQA